MNRWKHLFKRELRRILTDKRLGPILMAGPLMYVTVFGFVYWDGRTQHVPIAIADRARLHRASADHQDGCGRFAGTRFRAGSPT